MQQSLFGSLVAAPSAEAPPVVANDTPLTQALFTVIDLETTGLNARKNAVTEITAIQFVNGEEVAKYSTLVKPTEAISADVEAITGINNAMTAQAIAPIQALSELCRFVGEHPVIVGHNVAFDIGFLREKLDQTGLGAFADRFDLARAACTKVLAQKALPGLPSYAGVAVATQCGVYNPNPHRAEYDVRMSAGILFALIAQLRDRAGLSTLGDLLAYQGTLG